jgi:phage N-6-adenine-methyltransferase
MTPNRGPMNDRLAPLLSSAQHDWRTPRALFEAIQAIAGRFDLDAAADADNALCRHYFSRHNDALSQSWKVAYRIDGSGRASVQTNVWLNPPYGRALALFASKAVSEASHPGVSVWMLVPARPDTRWWATMMTRAVAVYFMAGRVKFEREDGARESAPFPTAIIQLHATGGDPRVIWGWRP